jgi:CRISPR system Cascade subunit CasB
MSWLIERLRKNKDNRGLMATLRCVLVAKKKHRAWPVLNRLGLAITDDDSAFVAGLYATHPEEITSGNFGTTCRKIELCRGEKRSDDNKLTPTERRFQHLLAAEKRELHSRVLRMVLMAKSQEVKINYEQLEIDLKFWSDRTKSEWGMAFWQGEASMAEEGA